MPFNPLWSAGFCMLDESFCMKMNAFNKPRYSAEALFCSFWRYKGRLTGTGWWANRGCVEYGFGGAEMWAAGFTHHCSLSCNTVAQCKRHGVWGDVNTCLNTWFCRGGKPLKISISNEWLAAENTVKSFCRLKWRVFECVNSHMCVVMWDQ